ncbi:MAG: Fur family transcriptional regulator, zinc uptake regulator [Pseudomonadota bacterium]|nr:Fur family transcriptional regulator, zinc uptake regulator [Pseudomonadota bacterium]
MTSKFEKIIDYCATKSIRLTNQQSIIIKIISETQLPLTANDILLKLKELNSTANRMTIHRALEILVQAGLIHKVAFNHTYKLCNHLYCNHSHSCQIFVCQNCHKQVEIHDSQITKILQTIGKSYGFDINYPIEITGKCNECI